MLAISSDAHPVSITNRLISISIVVFCDSIESDWAIPSVWNPTVFGETTSHAINNNY